MLHLSEKNALLTSVNPRSEIHGDEKKPAVDGEVAVRTGRREYRVEELMPLDVDPKNPEDVAV